MNIVRPYTGADQKSHFVKLESDFAATNRARKYDG